MQKHSGDVTDLKFDAFSQIYNTSLMWNKILFANQKKQQVDKRRALLKENKIKEYEQMCAKMELEDENHL